MTAKPSLRPFLAADADDLADIFRASVDALTQDDYSEGQREAWITLVDDVDVFRQKLAGDLTLVALIEGRAAGFAALKGGDRVDMLYVHPDFARRGVATMLVDALEKLAAARGAKSLTTDASDTARPLFAARGFEATSRNVLPLGDEWVANTTMVKPLGEAAKPKMTLQ